jgi:hypothetical protein
MSRERGQYDRTENHQQLSRLVRRKPRRLLDALLHSLLMLSKHLAEYTSTVGGRPRTDQTAEIPEYSRV